MNDPMSEQANEKAKKLKVLKVACGILAASGVLVLVLPLPVPWPVKAAVAGADLVAAAVVWLAVRQRMGR